MSSTALLFLVLGLGLMAWIAARTRAAAFAGDGPRGANPRHSLPMYHGWYVALWAVLPALLFLGIWSAVTPGLINGAVLATPEAAALPAFGMERRRHPGRSARAGDGQAGGRRSTRRRRRWPPPSARRSPNTG